MYRIRPKRKAFTLIELLMVITIIGILAALTFGIARGVKNAQSRAKAKAELIVLSQAIEQFKSRYGDYPWHASGGSDTNQMLLFALTGRMTMEVVNGDMVVELMDADQSDADVLSRPKFIDDAQFTTSKDDSGNSLQILDPWNNPYIYMYKSEGVPEAWDVFGFHLYSTGPNGEEANNAIKTRISESSGVIDNNFRDVANAEGIIFSGE